MRILTSAHQDNNKEQILNINHTNIIRTDPSSCNNNTFQVFYDEDEAINAMEKSLKIFEEILNEDSQVSCTVMNTSASPATSNAKGHISTKTTNVTTDSL